MTTTSGTGDMLRIRMRSGARLAALLVVALFLSLAGAEITEPDGFPANTGLLLGLMGLSFVGVLVAWRRERIGGVLLKVGAGAEGVAGWSSYSLFEAGEADLISAIPLFAGLSLLAGLLFFVSASLSETVS